MIRHPGADSFAVAGNKVHNARWYACFFTSLDEVVSRKWSVFSGFDYNGVAADQRGYKFPRWNRHRKIPRSDQATETDRLTHTHRKLAAHLGRSREAVQATSFASCVVRAVDCFLNVATSLFQHLAHFASHVGGELFLVPDQYLAQSKQDFSTLRCGRVTPAIERALRGVNRCVDVVAVGEWKAADDVAGVGRVDVLKHLARLTTNPLTVDIVLIVLNCGTRRVSCGRLPARFGDCFFCLSHKSVSGGTVLLIGELHDQRYQSIALGISLQPGYVHHDRVANLQRIQHALEVGK